MRELSSVCTGVSPQGTLNSSTFSLRVVTEQFNATIVNRICQDRGHSVCMLIPFTFYEFFQIFVLE